MIVKYLEDLEQRIEDAIEHELWAQWKVFVDGEFHGDIFSPKRARKAQPGVEWPFIPINDALESYEAMALQQLRACSDALAEGSGALLCARCNYGTGIIPTLFGADLFVMDKETDTLPTSIPLGGLESATATHAVRAADTTESAEAVKRLLDQGVPDLHNALGGKVLEMADYYQEVMAPYPKIQKYVTLYHPDMQGPMDICELLWGSGLFVALIETPDIVMQLLDLVTETYVQFMRAWTDIVPFKGNYAVHWSMLHKGNIMVRDDSAMNLSPRMFDRFIKPYDSRLLREFGGGGIHFCGRGDHYIKSASSIPGLTTINMSQPEYNNMECMFAHTVDQGINIVGLNRAPAEKALAQGRDLHGRVHCW